MRKLVIAVAAVGVMGLALGCSKARTDESIATEIKASMFSDAQTKSANISVAVNHGTATLTGQVPDANTRYEAFKIAKETSGVVTVEDQMSLPQAPVKAAARPVEDAAPISKPAREPKYESRPKRQVASSPAADYPVRTLAGAQNSAPQQAAASQPGPVVNDAPAPAAAPDPAPPAPAAPAPPPVRQVSISAGTPIHIQMIDSVDSATNHAGDLFRASLALPIAVDGETIVPAGADVFVKLTNASSAGRMTGRSQLTLQLARLDFQGKSYTLASDDFQETGKSRGKRTAETVGVGAGVGAIIGGIIGGGKGAAIGAGVGGGGGAAAEAATKGQQVRIQAEAKLDFNLQQTVTVSYSPDQNNSRR